MLCPRSLESSFVSSLLAFPFSGGFLQWITKLFSSCSILKLFDLGFTVTFIKIPSVVWVIFMVFSLLPLKGKRV